MCDRLDVSCVQMNCKPGDIKYNLKKAREFADKAVKNGTEILVFPELFDIGYDLSSLVKLDIDEHIAVDELAAIAKDNNMFIAAGLTEKGYGTFYNTLYVFNNIGETVLKYRKINLFSLSKENDYFTPGINPQSFVIKNIKVGVMICYDLRFPELGRYYLKDGCSVIIISSAFPKQRQEHWNTLLKARAIENQLYIIASNRVGSLDGLEFAGNSSIIDPWGNVLETLDNESEGIIKCCISMDKRDEVRKFIPCYNDMLRLEGLINNNKCNDRIDIKE
ncbi:carbon-nitrogen family hydrolase [Pseudobacteroides cellulosolvens]|uniref:Nitrilase/cyanide hydratase and apolipoprotein N-acyltransferase n=1 Tax=Pseudobacteroides cellulosolvens ATCC 35603 = DSM 2933 TaxID=398512 RepID=A0A0L6JJB5_9FIRM|nr:carbon-nitrogen family hydrolase [Pseudobacteroides cellulosolvens]KNY25773.1 Nitrilase/cyanide hydratase and apolipoprotein N-acyltransferase [Pseudobacteroides cellulosolvens ATCC 35603 = DSM 2933]